MILENKEALMGTHGVSAAALLLLAAIVTTPAAVRAQTQAPVTAFVHVSVIPMDRERILEDHTVLVQGDRITGLGPASSIAIPDGAVRVDGTGKFLMPGLADMHAHLAEDGTGRRLNTRVDVADMLFTFVANGVTTIRDMHSGPGHNGDAWMPALRARIAKGEVLAPRIYAAGDPDYSSPAAAAKSVAALEAAGYDYVKYAWNQPEIYDSVVAAARRVRLPVVGHLPYEVGVPHVLHDRWASIEHLYGYLEYIKGFDDWWGTRSNLPDRLEALQEPVADTTLRRLVQEVKLAGVWNCPTLAYVELSLRAYGLDEQAALSAAFYPRLTKALHDAGAELLLGTDANFMGGTLQWSGFVVHRELESLVAAGLTPFQALATGTTNAARFLGVEDSTGTIIVGKRADLVLLKGNPLVDIRQTTALAGVMVGGRWLPRAVLEERVEQTRSAPIKAVGDASTGMGDTLAMQMQQLVRQTWR